MISSELELPEMGYGAFIPSADWSSVCTRKKEGHISEIYKAEINVIPYSSYFSSISLLIILNYMSFFLASTRRRPTNRRCK